MARPKANKTKPAADERPVDLHEADPLDRFPGRIAKTPSVSAPTAPIVTPKTAHEMAKDRLQKARGL